MLKDRLTSDIKTALLAGDKFKAEVLKALKSAILYEEVAQKVREEGLADDKILVVLAREAKKRAESAELYEKGGQSERAKSELAEKAIIEDYLPKQLSDADLQAVVAGAVAELGEGVHMGQVIGLVKSKVGQTADGGRIAQAVKTKLQG